MHTPPQPKGINARRVLRMHTKDPHCHWCGQITLILDPMPDGGQLPDACATVDHVYSKLTVERRAGRGEFVLSCSGCNKWRAVIENKLCSPETRAQAMRMIESKLRKFIRHPFGGELPNIHPGALRDSEDDT